MLFSEEPHFQGSHDIQQTKRGTNVVTLGELGMLPYSVHQMQLQSASEDSFFCPVVLLDYRKHRSPVEQHLDCVLHFGLQHLYRIATGYYLGTSSNKVQSNPRLSTLLYTLS